MTTHIVLTKNGSVGDLIDSLDTAFRGIPVRVVIQDENGNRVTIVDRVAEILESVEDWQ